MAKEEPSSRHRRPPLRRRKPRTFQTTRLTRRETEVLALVALGFSNWEIGSLLYIETETVKSHVRHVLMKLGARTRAHAIWLAMSRELLGTSLRGDSFAPSSASTLTSATEWSGSPADLWKILTRDSHDSSATG